jgi:hypothetical protein
MDCGRESGGLQFNLLPGHGDRSICAGGGNVNRGRLDFDCAADDGNSALLENLDVSDAKVRTALRRWNRLLCLYAIFLVGAGATRRVR